MEPNDFIAALNNPKAKEKAAAASRARAIEASEGLTRSLMRYGYIAMFALLAIDAIALMGLGKLAFSAVTALLATLMLAAWQGVRLLAPTRSSAFAVLLPVAFFLSFAGATGRTVDAAAVLGLLLLFAGGRLWWSRHRRMAV
jgi:drug/metabolite transporter (DMT)-like permease